MGEKKMTREDKLKRVPGVTFPIRNCLDVEGYIDGTGKNVREWKEERKNDRKQSMYTLKKQDGREGGRQTESQTYVYT